METKHVSFDNMEIDAGKLEYFGVGLPRTHFEFEYDENDWVVTYPEAYEQFQGKTFDEALQKLVDFLREDPVIAELGDYSVSLE